MVNDNMEMLMHLKAVRRQMSPEFVLCFVSFVTSHSFSHILPG